MKKHKKAVVATVKAAPELVQTDAKDVVQVGYWRRRRWVARRRRRRWHGSARERGQKLAHARRVAAAARASPTLE